MRVTQNIQQEELASVS